MNLTLYQLKGEWLALVERLSDMDLPPEAIADTIEGSDVQMALEEKAQGYELVARNFEAMVPAIDSEIKRLQSLKKGLNSRADHLRERVLRAMQIMGIEKITCPLFELRRQKNPAKLDVFEAALVPAEYWIQPPKEIDNETLKKALKDGKEIQGARLTQGESLRIK